MDEVTVESLLDTRTAEAPCEPCRLAHGVQLGEWRVEAYLGAGLSAEVYRVTNMRFAQEGALKLLVDSSRGLRERFLMESDAIRFLSLKALPRFLGSGEHAGMPYYVMEYLQPLPDPMPRGEVPSFMNKVAKAVQMLHDAGYIHRDLKPANLLRRRNGDPVLIDLGLIKKRDRGVVDQIVRRGRDISMIDGKPVGVGTVDYAAPEQLLKGESSVQSDVFALGKVLRTFYEGRPPRGIQRIVQKATSEQPADRYPSADAFAAALRHLERRPITLSLLAAVAVAFAAFTPMMLPSLAELVRQIINPPQRILSRKPNETDVAYLRRMLPLAEQGDDAARIIVAEMYFYGRGTDVDKEEAVRWYRLAAVAGEADAQASLGQCLFHGNGCAVNREEAAYWWRQAAEQGNLAGMNDLALCYLNGFGVEKDQKAGFEWAMKAAVRGHPPAQTMVGECYLHGFGVEVDVRLGETWLYRASRQDNKRAQKLLRDR